MNILVTGAGGQLGRSLREASRNSSDKYFFADIVELPDTYHLDITSSEEVDSFVRANSIGVIVNCAAFTNVDGAEDNEPLADLLNGTAPGILARCMKEVGGTLFHISTDYVFGKEQYNTPCPEDRTGTPSGAYGRTKLHGEQEIISSGCDYLIIRTAWLYSEWGRNFLLTMRRLTAEREVLDVVFDQVGTPTYAMDLAEAIFSIVEERKYLGRGGIYNYTNEGVCSWYDFALCIAELSGNPSCKVRPCHSSQFPSKVQRPSYSVLDKTRIKDVFEVEIPHWTTSLRKCINNLQNQ